MLKIDFNDLSDFDFPVGENFKLTVTSDNFDYEFIIHLKYGSDKIICIAPESGTDFSKTDLDTSLIHYNESPGDAENIAEIITKIADELNIEHKNLFFYGKGEGAVTSLRLASMIRDSTAVALSPSFVNQDFSSDLMIRQNYIPKAVIISNFTDIAQFTEKINLLSSLSDNGNSVKLILNSSEPLSDTDTVKLLNGITSGNMMRYISDEDSELICENKMLKKENEELKKVLMKWGDEAYRNVEEVEEIKGEMDSLLNSKSWKITKPLRKTTNSFKTIFKR